MTTREALLIVADTGPPIPLRQYQVKRAANRFWAKVIKTDECWTWTARRFPKGYGEFSVNGRFIYAHRFSYELHYGAISDGLCVCHHCDNPPCVRPDHLFLGTNSKNIRDRVQKGRSRPARGAACHFAKLTQDQIVEIRQRYQPRVVTMQMLAEEYGVTKQVVCLIIHRKVWKHV